MAAQYNYYSWVRTGNARLLTTPDDPAANVPARGTVALTARVTTDDVPGRTADLSVRLYGPGDVIGLDARQVIRTDPPNRATDFEPNLFPVVEFYWPDLPWLFMPTKEGADGRLRPWLCLVVVKQEGNPLRYDPGRPLPVLTVANPAAELPNLAQSWAWAHAQIIGTVAAGTETELLASVSDRTLSRLMCPRRLEANTAYRACIVPAFEAGRKAGLGLPLAQADETLSPAWKGDVASLELPVYYQWEFSTGPAGDFEALMWELRPRDVPAGAGYRRLPVRQPAPTWPVDQEAVLGSALRPLGPPPAGGVSTDFRKALVGLLNAHEDWEGKVDLPQGMPLPPPFYARWHAAQPTLADEGVAVGPDNALWLRELNLDPGMRAAAGLGAQVVRDQQEALMASAWDQLGNIERANEALRHAQLAMEIGRRIYAQHILPLATGQLLALTGPVQGRVFDAGAGLTVRGAVNASCLPASATGGAFRRLTRARGPLGRRLGGNLGVTGRLLQRLNQPKSPAAPQRQVPGGMVTAHRLDLPALCETVGKDAPAVRGEPPGYARSRDVFVGALKEVRAALKAFCADPPDPCNPLDTTVAVAMLTTGLDPQLTAPARIGARLKLPAGRVLDPALNPILAHPVFPQPMYRPLAELSQDFLLSGIENIPPDTILLLDTNPAFVEAYMAGLNDEMGRELLWRSFPTDQRGTYFRRFWDPQSELTRDTQDVYDITPLHTWKPAETLGAHRPGGAVQPAVLLIRGRLPQRFPNALIYACKAEFTPGGNGKRQPVQPAEESWPIFQATVPPDMTFLGFNLPAETMRGKQDPVDNQPGWFIILQQQPSQPRYGLDETRPAVAKGTWEDLSWLDVPLSNGHINLDGSLDGAFSPPVAPPDDAIQWGATLTSAGLAYMTLQTPARVAIHASDLLRA